MSSLDKIKAVTASRREISIDLDMDSITQLCDALDLAVDHLEHLRPMIITFESILNKGEKNQFASSNLIDDTIKQIAEKLEG